MSVLDCLDALAVHALASAKASGGDGFRDVSVGSANPRGRCGRLFYAGQVPSEYFGETVLDAQEVAELVIATFFWPAPQSSVKEQRRLEFEASTFAHEYRTRLNADRKLGGATRELLVRPNAPFVEVELSGANWYRLLFEIGLDITEYTYAE